MPLRKAPVWMKRPCGATFGFGGKLVSFVNHKVRTKTGVGIAIACKNICLCCIVCVCHDRKSKLDVSLRDSGTKSSHPGCAKQLT